MEVQPTGTAALTYSFNMATAALNYAHQAMPNIATGTVNFVDTVSLRFSLPIALTGLIAVGSVGYARMQPLTSAQSSVAADNVLSTTNVVIGDAALNYQPRRVETLTLGVRGQITRQLASGTISDTTAALEDDLTRYTISLNVTYSYPRANAALVRPSLAPLYSVQAPTPAEIISTDRFFGDPVAGPAPAEPAPKPVKAP